MEMQGTNGCKYMKMGVDGCGLMRWGPWGTKDTKTRQGGDIYGLKGGNLGAMAGEISPDIMFWKNTKKHV